MTATRACALASAFVVLLLASVAEAKITIRRHATYDNFFFHANYGADAFDPSQGFAIEIWNCASGAMPTFIADREPLIVCDFASDGSYTLADLVYSIDVPGGTCVDHGRACYYRNTAVPSLELGVRYFKVQYARPGRGNRVWLDSYGDLSAADQANMLILNEIDAHPRAIRSDTFIPLGSDGWFSR